MSGAGGLPIGEWLVGSDDDVLGDFSIGFSVDMADARERMRVVLGRWWEAKIWVGSVDGRTSESWGKGEREESTRGIGGSSLETRDGRVYAT